MRATCRLCVMVLRAVVGWYPPAWLRPRPEAPGAEMSLTGRPTTYPESYIRTGAVHERGVVDEADELERQVRAEVVENTKAARRARAQSRGVATFEERARETLRDLMSDMSGKR